MNIHWEWPVPFPTDVTTLGADHQRRRWREGMLEVCASSATAPSSLALVSCAACASSCSGYTSPCVLDPNQKGCTMKLPACGTGRMGGFGGGVIAIKQ